MTKTRVLAALVMAPVAIAAILLLSTPWLLVAAAVVFLLALWEWFKLAEIEDTLSRTVLLVVNLLLMVLLVWASAGSLVLFQLVTLAGVVWWLLAAVWLRFPGFACDHETWARMFKLAAGTLAVVPAWCALGLIHAADAAPTILGGIREGHVWLLTALAIVWGADSGAYFAGRHFGGRWFGGRKLAPLISPNKTWEGVVGGIVAGVLIGLLFASLAGLSLSQVPLMILLAVITVAVSVVGDLYESLLKRHVGAKDSSNLIPGHGGVLDRIDGVLAALPVFALFKDLFGL